VNPSTWSVYTFDEPVRVTVTEPSVDVPRAVNVTPTGKALEAIWTPRPAGTGPSTLVAAGGGELVQEPRDTVYATLVKVTHIAVPSVTARCWVCRSVD
jgi:hypothetical protein